MDRTHAEADHPAEAAEGEGTGGGCAPPTVATAMVGMIPFSLSTVSGLQVRRPRRTPRAGCVRVANTAAATSWPVGQHAVLGPRTERSLCTCP